MTNATSDTLTSFIQDNGFTSLTLVTLIAIAVLAIAIIQLEVLRTTRSDQHARNGRVLAIAIYPFGALATAVIVARFMELA